MLYIFYILYILYILQVIFRRTTTDDDDGPKPQLFLTNDSAARMGARRMCKTLRWRESGSNVAGHAHVRSDVSFVLAEHNRPSYLTHRNSSAWRRLLRVRHSVLQLFGIIVRWTQWITWMRWVRLSAVLWDQRDRLDFVTITWLDLSDGPQKNVSRAHHSSSVSDFRW